MGLLLVAMVWLNRRLPSAALERRESDDAYSLWEYETGRRIFTEHFGDPAAALRELARVLRPEGRMFFETQLNRMSVRRFVALVRAEPRLRLARLACVPLEFPLLRPLTAVPLLREWFTGLVVAELERAA